MSDTTAVPATEAPQEPAQASETDWRAEARKWESRAKENRAAARERDTLTEMLKSRDADIESLRAQVAAFEHANQVQTWKAEAAAEHKVPVEALRGDTAEEIKAHAKVISALLAQRPKGPVVPTAGKTPEKTDSTLAETVRTLFNRQG